VPIAREGVPFILAVGILAIVAFAVGWTWSGWAATLAATLVLAFFRDPPRCASVRTGSVLAPADGRVVKAAEVQDTRFLKAAARQVSIFMSPLNVHVNRNPVSGRVAEVRYHSGRYFRAFADKASLDNEQNSIVLEASSQRRMAFVQIAGFLARRIVCYLKPGMMVVRGERCGMIMFGSRVDVFLPIEARLCVDVGTRTRAGETVIAEWETPKEKCG